MDFLEEAIFKKHRSELILVAISCAIFFGSIIIVGSASNPIKPKNDIVFKQKAKEKEKEIEESKIFVDIAGAVEKPDVYEITSGARLKDVLIQAKGLSSAADREYVARNFNFARLVADQEKIYIPSRDEILEGYFLEPKASAQVLGQSISSNERINVNAAGSVELDKLPGVGPVTANKIITNRPYSSVDELLSKKAVGKSVFEKIKELFVVN